MSILDEHLKHRLLTREEERELSERFLAGDQAAGQKLAMHNLRYVKKIARRYTYNDPKHEEFWDLFQEGVIGLMRAVELWRTDMGSTFMHYAYRAVNSQVQDYIRNKRPLVRIPNTKEFASPDVVDITYHSGILPDQDEREELRIQEEQCQIVDALLPALDEKQAQVTTGLFYKDLPLREVGEQLGCSHERIRQIRDRSLHLLRKAAQAKKLRKEEVPYQP